MSKTLIDINDEVLREAAKILSTDTKKETVNAALAEIVGQKRRMRLLNRFVNDPELREDLKRQRDEAWDD